MTQNIYILIYFLSGIFSLRDPFVVPVQYLKVNWGSHLFFVDGFIFCGLLFINCIDIQVLNGFSFKAEPGQKIAFVGKTGCGKSTSMDLLQRFYDRTGGEIRVDGQLIEHYDTNILRKHCGVVAQTNVLLKRSIYENIVYGMEKPPGPESPEFMEVCSQAQAWEFIQNFPNK